MHRHLHHTKLRISSKQSAMIDTRSYTPPRQSFSCVFSWASFARFLTALHLLCKLGYWGYCELLSVFSSHLYAHLPFRMQQHYKAPPHGHTGSPNGPRIECWWRYALLLAIQQLISSIVLPRFTGIALTAYSRGLYLTDSKDCININNADCCCFVAIALNSTKGESWWSCA